MHTPGLVFARLDIFTLVEKEQSGNLVFTQDIILQYKLF